MWPSLAKGSARSHQHGNCTRTIDGALTVILSDLVACGLILVEVVLPVEAAPMLDLTVQC